MSFHVSPPFHGAAARPVEVLTVPFERIRETAPVALSARPAAATDQLSVHLDHINLVLAVSAASTGASHLAFPGLAFTGPFSSEPTDGTIHVQIPGDSLPAAFRLGGGPAGAAGNDPVIHRLSQALDAAESGSDEFGGVYADALRLAIFTRMLSIRPGDAFEARETEPEVAPSPRRPKSGLPKWRLKRVVAYIDENLGESVTLSGMADAAGLSRMHFAAQFRVTTGLRPHEFLLRRRIEKAQAMMVETRDSLVAIALEVGFQTQAHFTTVFRRFVGDTPHQWRSAQRSHG